MCEPGAGAHEHERCNDGEHPSPRGREVLHEVPSRHMLAAILLSACVVPERWHLTAISDGSNTGAIAQRLTRERFATVAKSIPPGRAEVGFSDVGWMTRSDCSDWETSSPYSSSSWTIFIERRMLARLATPTGAQEKSRPTVHSQPARAPSWVSACP